MSTTPPTDPLGTHAEEVIHMDLQSRVAIGSLQWLLEKSTSHPITTSNRMTTLIGGENGFAAIAQDIHQAKDTIDLICWGFDPGMALQRNQSNPRFAWAGGEPYGELLKAKAAQGVHVRLLVWYNPRGSAKQNSLIGYVVPDSYLQGATIDKTWSEHNPKADPTTKPLLDQRTDYCTEWWRQATCGQIPNLEVRYRDGVSQQVGISLQDEADPPSSAGGAAGGYMDEAELLNHWATHHQKTILIDYQYANPQDPSQGPGHKAVGYVMGLNSLTDFWDTHSHAFDSPLRELDLVPGTLRDGNDAVSTAAHKALNKDRSKDKPALFMSRRPLRDYACRIEGDALYDVYLNFCTAWNRAALLPMLRGPNTKDARQPSAALKVEPKPSSLAIPINREQRHLALRLQILRTQPQEPFKTTDKEWGFDKSVKHAYFHVAGVARSYLYLENQYFYYEEWARHLKANRQAFMQWLQAAGVKSAQARLLHVLAVIPVPENENMVPRTYDTLRSLGQADSFAAQDAMVRDAQQMPASLNVLAQAKRDIMRVAAQVATPTLDTQGVLMQEGRSLGLKVLVCKLVSQNQQGNAALGQFRDVYIHSKLLLADDCFMTLGSANLNQRSMAADSEINVATDNIAHNRDLRQRVWAQLTGDKYPGGSGTQAEFEDTFFKWSSLAADNAGRIKDKQNLVGQIVKFSDGRTATDRVG